MKGKNIRPPVSTEYTQNESTTTPQSKSHYENEVIC
jgi:hypothetical protein